MFLFSVGRLATISMSCVLLAATSLKAQMADVIGVARRTAAQPIRPGDRIDLKFMRDPDLNATLEVNDRGDAVFPKLGTINVGNIAIGALRDTLVTRYREYIREPELQVSVARRVVVNGEVRLPDVYYLDATSSVRDAIAKAGGLKETASKGKVTVVRGSQRIRANAWETSQAEANDVQSGDQIIVARQPWLQLNALSVISTSVIVVGLIRSLRH